ncbi:hypothetical protein P4493_04645 [Bacillus thuringiensis]|nr:MULTISPECIES: hypothetical protein [Bacillus]MEC2535166.1 hypothetical protein [Bacillus cereus]MED1153719.1 hypothetical protein [Bacillus paranthracis]AFQ30039.1 hypothetical protein BTF1_29692 [Bacillus thuringiensis HD-789]AJG74058.1 hypothetical protein BF38_5833 [Bacillus thuringiensis]AJH02639.1 hypothetical protein AS86_6067 [Bacillus thuringiensis HD1002]
MKRFFTEFISAETPNQDVCQEVVEAKSRNELFKSMRKRSDVGLLLRVEDRGEVNPNESCKH